MQSRYLDAEGTVISITYPGAGTTPAVRVTIELDDRLLVLVFQSRHTLHSLEIGNRVRVCGNVVAVAGMPTIYNPNYMILPVKTVR